MDELPQIQVTINSNKYIALVDTGSTLSIIDDRLTEFNKIPIEPIYFSTVTGKDSISYEVHTLAPDEFKTPPNAWIKWKVKRLPNRGYEFIIGMDLLSQLNTSINKALGNIIRNRQCFHFNNIPYVLNQICMLETIDANR